MSMFFEANQVQGFEVQLYLHYLVYPWSTVHYYLLYSIDKTYSPERRKSVTFPNQTK